MYLVTSLNNKKQFEVSMNNRIFYPSFIPQALVKLLPYLSVTLGVTIVTAIFSIALSVILVKAQIGKNVIAKKVAKVYVGALRCTPAIVLLFIVFYGIPKLFLLFKIDVNFWPKAIFVIIALTLLYAANLSEIFRAALETLGKGQYEAAVSIGLTNFQAYRRIVIPQVLKIALPNLGNSFISLLKEGSLAYTIGFVDLIGKGNRIIALNFGAYAIETYIALALIYWSLTLIFEAIFKYFEKKFSFKQTVANGDEQ